MIRYSNFAFTVHVFSNMSILKFVYLFASTQIKSIMLCVYCKKLNPTDRNAVRCHDFLGNFWFITQWHKILTEVALNTKTLPLLNLVTFVDDRKDGGVHCIVRSCNSCSQPFLWVHMCYATYTYITAIIVCLKTCISWS